MQRANTMSNSGLLDRIQRRQARIGIIGLGYVGLPLAVEFARAGFDVTGFDIDEAKLRELRACRSYVPDVPDSQIAEAVHAGKLHVASDMRGLTRMDVIDIC